MRRYASHTAILLLLCITAGCVERTRRPFEEAERRAASELAADPAAAFSDDFDSLDTEKWWTVLPSWKGSVPGYFVPGNSQVRDGILRMYVYKPEIMPETAPAEYTYTAAVLKSRSRLLYGRITVRSRSHAARVTSGFWLNHVSDAHWNEIDVYELNHRWRNSGRFMPTNLHVFRVDGEDFEPRKSFQHTVRFEDADAAPDVMHDNSFNTYTLDWTPTKLVFLLNDVPVRCVENRYFHQPMSILLSASIQVRAGLPSREELDTARPYEVDYIRTRPYRPEADSDSRGDGSDPCAGLLDHIEQPDRQR